VILAEIAVHPAEATDSAAVAVDFNHGFPVQTFTPSEMGTGESVLEVVL